MIHFSKKTSMWVATTVALALGVSSCSKDNSFPLQSSVNQQEKEIIAQYVDHVVVDTYRSLANAALELQSNVEELKTAKTQENVNKACQSWKKARKYWEQSEAFLFGAAADNNIDPHIDTWPLDQTQLSKTLESLSSSNDFKAGDLGENLLGFHALEFVLFENGQPKKVSSITDKHLNYALGVSEDLALHTVKLEASWAGMDNTSPKKQKLLTQAEMEPSRNYGEEMKLAGQVGSPYKTTADAIVEILNGAITIADEVGNTKINDPVESGDVMEVESQFSWNSLTDFVDNIISIENAYLGGVENHRSAEKSLSAYIKAKNPSVDAKILAGITKAKEEIKNIGEPFRSHLTKGNTDKAIEACNELKNALEEAKKLIK